MKLSLKKLKYYAKTYTLNEKGGSNKRPRGSKRHKADTHQKVKWQE